MPYEIQINHTDRIVEVTFSGLCRLSDLKDAVIDALVAAKEFNIELFLSDCRQFIPERENNIMNSYELSKFYSEVSPNVLYHEAIISPPDEEIKAGLKFFETASVNRGFFVKVFTDKDEALSWLLKK